MTPIHNEEPLINCTAVPQIIQHIEQCKVSMQTAWLSLKSFNKVVDRGCLHVNVEEIWSVHLSKKTTFDSFPLISQLL